MIALKVHAPERFGRIRMQRIPDASGDSFIPFVRNNIKSGSVVITESWKGYNMIEKYGFIHKKISIPAVDILRIFIYLVLIELHLY